MSSPYDYPNTIHIFYNIGCPISLAYHCASWHVADARSLSESSIVLSLLICKIEFISWRDNLLPSVFFITIGFPYATTRIEQWIFIKIAIRNGLSNIEVFFKLIDHYGPEIFFNLQVYYWKSQFFMKREKVNDAKRSGWYQASFVISEFGMRFMQNHVHQFEHCWHKTLFCFNYILHANICVSIPILKLAIDNPLAHLDQNVNAFS
jgi:hypothetical protein